MNRGINKHWIATRLLPIFLGLVLVTGIVIAAVPSWRQSVTKFFQQFGPKADILDIAEELIEKGVEIKRELTDDQTERGSDILTTKLNNDPDNIYLTPPNKDLLPTDYKDYSFDNRTNIRRAKDKISYNISQGPSCPVENKIDESNDETKDYDDITSITADFIEENPPDVTEIFAKKSVNQKEIKFDILSSKPKIPVVYQGEELSYTKSTIHFMDWRQESHGPPPWPGYPSSEEGPGNSWVLDGCGPSNWVTPGVAGSQMYAKEWVRKYVNKPDYEALRYTLVKANVEYEPTDITVKFPASPIHIRCGEPHYIYEGPFCLSKTESITLKTPFIIIPKEGWCWKDGQKIPIRDYFATEGNCNKKEPVSIQHKVTVKSRSELVISQIGVKDNNPVADFANTNENIPILGSPSEIKDNKFSITLSNTEYDKLNSSSSQNKDLLLSSAVKPLFIHARKIENNDAVIAELKDPNIDYMFNKSIAGIDYSTYANKDITISIPQDDQGKAKGELGYIKKIGEESNNDGSKTFKYQFTPIQTQDNAYIVKLNADGFAKDSEGNVLVFKPNDNLEGNEIELTAQLKTDNDKEGTISSKLKILKPMKLEFYAKVTKRLKEKKTSAQYPQKQENTSLNKPFNIDDSKLNLSNLLKINKAQAQEDDIEYEICDAETGCDNSVLFPGDKIRFSATLKNTLKEDITITQASNVLSSYNDNIFEIFENTDDYKPEVSMDGYNLTSGEDYNFENGQIDAISPDFEFRNAKNPEGLILKPNKQIKLSFNLEIKNNLDLTKYNKLDFGYVLSSKNDKRWKAEFSRPISKIPKPKIELVEILDENNQVKKEHQDKLMPGDIARYKVVINPGVDLNNLELTVFIPNKYVTIKDVQGNGTAGFDNKTPFINWKIDEIKAGNIKEYYFKLKLDNAVPIQDQDLFDHYKTDGNFNQFKLFSYLAFLDFNYVSKYEFSSDIWHMIKGKITGPYKNPVPGVNLSFYSVSKIEEEGQFYITDISGAYIYPYKWPRSPGTASSVNPITSSETGNYELPFTRESFSKPLEDYNYFININFANIDEEKPAIQFFGSDDTNLYWKIKISDLIPKTKDLWPKEFKQDIDIYKNFASNPKPEYPKPSDGDVFLQTAMAAEDFYWLHKAIKIALDKDLIDEYPDTIIIDYADTDKYYANGITRLITLGKKLWEIFPIPTRYPNVTLHELTHVLDYQNWRPENFTSRCLVESCKYAEPHLGYGNDFSNNSLLEAFANFLPQYFCGQITGKYSHIKYMFQYPYDLYNVLADYQIWRYAGYKMFDDELPFKTPQIIGYSAISNEEDKFISMWQHMFENSSGKIDTESIKIFLSLYKDTWEISHFYFNMFHSNDLPFTYKNYEFFKQAGIFYDANGNWQYDEGEEVGRPANGIGFNQKVRIYDSNGIYDDWIEARPDRKYPIIPGSNLFFNSPSTTKFIHDDDFNVDRKYNTYNFNLVSSDNTQNQTIDVFNDQEFYFEMPYEDSKLYLTAENSPDYQTIISENYWDAIYSGNFEYIANYDFRTIQDCDELAKQHEQKYLDKRAELESQGIAGEELEQQLQEFNQTQINEHQKCQEVEGKEPMTLDKAIELESQKEPEQQSEEIQQIEQQQEQIQSQIQDECQALVNQHTEEYTQRLNAGEDEGILKAWRESVIESERTCFEAKQQELYDLSQQQEQVEQNIVDNTIDQQVDENNQPIVNDEMQDSREEAQNEQAQVPESLTDVQKARVTQLLYEIQNLQNKCSTQVQESDQQFINDNQDVIASLNPSFSFDWNQQCEENGTNCQLLLPNSWPEDFRQKLQTHEKNITNIGNQCEADYFPLATELESIYNDQNNVYLGEAQLWINQTINSTLSVLHIDDLYNWMFNLNEEAGDNVLDYEVQNQQLQEIYDSLDGYSEIIPEPFNADDVRYQGEMPQAEPTAEPVSFNQFNNLTPSSRTKFTTGQATKQINKNTAFNVILNPIFIGAGLIQDLNPFTISNVYAQDNNQELSDNQKPSMYFTRLNDNTSEENAINEAVPGQTIVINASNFKDSKNIQIYLDNQFLEDAKILGGGFGIKAKIPLNTKKGTHTIKLIGDAQGEYVFKDIIIKRSFYISNWIYYILVLLLVAGLGYLYWRNKNKKQDTVI